MVEEITVKRSLPVNLKPEDNFLFEHARTATFFVLPTTILEKAVIFQDTAFSLKDLKFYTEYTHVHELGLLPKLKRTITCALKRWRKIPDGIWIKDEWSANYFHWMTDCLPRIWKAKEFGASDRIILHDSFKHLAYVRESLDLLGIIPCYFSSSENLWVDKLVLTPRTANFPNFNEPLTRLTRTKFGVKPTRNPFQKVYISRKLAEKRKAHNELDVELLMLKHGFEIVYAEKLPLKKQIELMAETRILISLHGAALTNMIFMQEGQHVIELRNQGDSKNQCFFNLASAMGLNYYYTLNHADSPDTIISDFTIDVAELESLMLSLEK
ncbi:glycosyltransferase family 61 protein [Algoriphagus marinus]|uniref:glycosyltransferase family 61 protein n=1 Tax=Algoriphagus marinus TaxID=1925762 RepID=UPI00094BA2C6|nr:glycosyltransferase family 61 protein [Algoriphagus marinus]